MLVVRTRRRVAAGVLSAGTLEMQLQHVRYLLERLTPDLPIAAIDSETLEQLVAVEEKGRRVLANGQTRQLSGGTVRKRLSTLRQALDLQVHRGALEKLPIFPEVPYLYRPSRARLYDHSDYLRLLLALPRARAEWLALAVWSGQRHSDVERMRREDFDPHAVDAAGAPAPWIIVRSWKTRRYDGIRIAAAPEIVRMLAHRWEQLRGGAPLVEPWPHASGQIGDVCERIGLPRLSAHSMRHTFFTWYVAANGFTPELLELGGWSTLAMPAKVYAHAIPARFAEQIARTAIAAMGPRRPPQRIPVPSRDGAGPPTGGTVGGPMTTRGRDPLVVDPNGELASPGYSADRKDTAPKPQVAVSSRSVGAERIELSTNGLRVCLCVCALTVGSVSGEVVSATADQPTCTKHS